jgi:D-amino-acid dehydrogenase
MSSPDVVVIGAGAIGAASTYELVRRGARVTVLERSHVVRGCSYGNAGLICPSHAEALASPAAIHNGLRWMGRRDSPFHIRPRLSVLPWLARFGAASLPARSAAGTATLRRLADASLELHEQLARSGLPTSFVRRGILSVYESERAFAKARDRIAGGPPDAQDTRVLAAEAARELEPGLAPTFAGAIHHRREAHCDPSAFVAALMDASRDLGANVRCGVEILRLRRTGGRLAALETTAGPLRAGAVVVAAGAWTRDLLGDVGLYVPLEGAKGYHLEMDARPLEAGIPLYMEEAHVIATPLGGRLRLAGTLELSGRDLRVDPVRMEALGSVARRTMTLPAEARTVQMWRGLRPCTPDGLPVIGPADGLANMFVATGHAMLGITLAPATGQIVAGLVSGEEPPHDIEPFRLSRFRRLRDHMSTKQHAPTPGTSCSP